MANNKTNENIPWFKMTNDKFIITPESASKLGITADKCTVCTDIMISKVYQSEECGSRCCQHCFENLNDKYYCSVCAADDPDNIVHNKKSMYEDKALMKEMDKKSIECPDCKLLIRILNLKDHTVVCSKGWVCCPGCGQMVKQSPDHVCGSLDNDYVDQMKYKMCPYCGKECENLENHQSECSINWQKRFCPFGCGRLNTKMERHRQDQNLFHLDKAWAVLHSHKLTASKNENSTQFKDLLKRAVDNVRKSINFDMDTFETLSKELKHLNETIAEDAKIYKAFKDNLTLQIADTFSTSFDGTIVWRIDKFDEIKKRAKNENQKSIFSPPFYTSRFGYKMCLRLYPNGDSTACNVAMSLFLVILKGDYDSLLRWPFKQKVTFILLDQDFKCNMIDAFVPSDNAASFLRPRTDMNVPSGSSYFIKFDDMKLRNYVKDNTVFIRCIIDCSDLH